MGVRHRDRAAVGRAVPPRVGRQRARRALLANFRAARAGGATAARQAPREPRSARSVVPGGRDARPPARRRCRCSCAGSTAVRARPHPRAFLAGREWTSGWTAAWSGPESRSSGRPRRAASGSRSSRGRRPRPAGRGADVETAATSSPSSAPRSTGAGVRPPACRSTSTGFVGYLGYEMKAECGATAGHRAPLPDAQLLLADRLVAVDHAERAVYLVALADEDVAGRASGGSRGRGAAEATAALPATPTGPPRHPAAEPPRFALDRGRRALPRRRRALRGDSRGETYEVCLTDQLRARVASIRPLHRALRRAARPLTPPCSAPGATAVFVVPRAVPPDRSHGASRRGRSRAPPARGEPGGGRRAGGPTCPHGRTRREPDDRRPGPQRPRRVCELGTVERRR